MGKMGKETKSIVLGGGCFWCTEAVFELFEGIIKITPGYSGGKAKNPTYKEVCSGTTGHLGLLTLFPFPFFPYMIFWQCLI